MNWDNDDEDFRAQLDLKHVQCPSRMKYDPYYATFECPYCGMQIVMRMNRK